MWDVNIDGVTMAIAADPSPNVFVLAGPGTGKTFAMMRRIARLLEEGVPPTRILAVSFTRTAAEDLFRQLDALGVPGASAVETSTLHSWAFRLLTNEDVMARLGRYPRPLLGAERNALITDLAGAFNGKREAKKKLKAFEAGWARLQGERPGHPHTPADQAFNLALTEWLRFHRAMLIGEVVPIALTFFRQNPALVRGLAEYDHVLVDEYQDLNRCEQELISQISATGHVAIIGDDNQSIYSFKHANPEGIRTYLQVHGNASHHDILNCRRCPSNIVSMSNALIAHDPRTLRPTPLVGHSGDPDAVVEVLQSNTPDTEAAAVTSRIVRWVKQDGLPEGQVLVLAPRRFFGNKVRDRLRAQGIAALSFFSERPLEGMQAAKGICLLRLVADWTDLAAMRAWWALDDSADTLAKEYARVRAHVSTTESSLHTALDQLGSGELTLRYVRRLPELFSVLKEEVAMMQSLPLAQLVDTIWPAGNEECEEVREMALRLADTSDTAQSLVRRLIEEIVQPTLPGPSDGIVRIMSLHKSKGLTAQAVAILGASAEAMPGGREANESDEAWQARIEEQRRLFYVAITRAKQSLVISSSALIDIGDGMRQKIVSARRLTSASGSYFRLSMSPFVDQLGPMCPAPRSA